MQEFLKSSGRMRLPTPRHTQENDHNDHGGGKEDKQKPSPGEATIGSQCVIVCTVDGTAIPVCISQSSTDIGIIRVARIVGQIFGGIRTGCGILSGNGGIGTAIVWQQLVYPVFYSIDNVIHRIPCRTSRFFQNTTGTRAVVCASLYCTTRAIHGRNHTAGIQW